MGIALVIFSKNGYVGHYGAVHKVRHATFWPILTPLPSVTLCHTSRDPLPKVRHTSRTPQFLVGLGKKPGQSPLYKFYPNLSGGFLSGGGVVRVGFCPFHVLSQYI